jgi:hypothetical protein
MHAMEDEAAWRELFDDLSEAAAVALSATPASEMRRVRRARNLLLRLANTLDRGFEPPFSLMLQGIEAAYVIGKYCVSTPPVEKVIGQERAAHARDKRSQSPQEIARRTAIKAEYEAMSKRGTPVDLSRPYAAAETLLGGVNRRLKAAAKPESFGFKPIKSKALGDRLKKLQPDIGIDGNPRPEELKLEQRGALAARQLLGKK